jgi:hypothetical protein
MIESDSVVLRSIDKHPGAVLGRFANKYSKNIQIDLLLGHIPIDVIRKMHANADRSIINSSELPLEARIAYRDLLDYFELVMRDSPRTRVPGFQRARELFRSLDRRIYTIDTALKNDWVYNSVRDRKAS